MNFLSHFYIYQDGDRPEYSLGLILPDLCRGYVKNPGKLDDEYNMESADLVRGCLAHYKADKRFHSSKYFEEGTAHCIELLKQARFETQVERRWFLGHILFELLLDRILVRHQPEVGRDFYDQLNRVDEQLLREFLVLHEHKELDRFFRFFEHFRKAAYIRNYPDNNLFAFSLSRIVIRAGLPAMSFADKMVLQECVLELERTYFCNAQAVLFELKEVFA